MCLGIIAANELQNMIDADENAETKVSSEFAECLVIEAGDQPHEQEQRKIITWAERSINHGPGHCVRISLVLFDSFIISFLWNVIYFEETQVSYPPTHCFPGYFSEQYDSSSNHDRDV